MAKKGLVDGLNIVGSVKLKEKCEDCIYGKQTVHPYDKAIEPETEVLEQVYIDLWGPAHVCSVGGAEYMMVFNDGGSSYWVGYFLHSKSTDTTLSAFTEYHVKSEQETGKKLIWVRVNIGSEFLNNKWKGYTTKHGIIVEFSAPYTHGQNRVAEHGMQIIIERTWCLLTNSGLPPSLWADAASFTIYTGNLIPSTHHPGCVPAERWTNKRQDVSHLHPFGCNAYTRISGEIGVSKLAPHLIKYVLISYLGHGTYKLWDQASGTTIKSCDVIFEEGSGHRGISTAPTPVLNVAFDDVSSPVPSHNALNKSPGVIVPPKPLAPCHHVTDPPPAPRIHNAYCSQCLIHTTQKLTCHRSTCCTSTLCSPCRFGNWCIHTKYNSTTHHTP